MELLALTLHRPWSDAIVHGPKRIENRPWKPWKRVMGNLILIHGGKHFDYDGRRWMAENGLYQSGESLCGIVGAARVVGCVDSSDDPWFFGPYGWVLDDVAALPCPVSCRGAQGLWKVPHDVAEMAVSLLGEDFGK